MGRFASTAAIWLTAALLCRPAAASAPVDSQASPRALAALSARIAASYRKIIEDLDDQIQAPNYPRPIVVLSTERERLEDLLPRYFAMRRDLGLADPGRLDLAPADQSYLDGVRSRINRLRYGSEDEGLVAQVDGAEGEYASWRVQGAYIDGGEPLSALTADQEGPAGELASWRLQGVALMEEVVANASGIRE